MGNPEGTGRADERPQRSVYLDEFAIDQVEVTNARFLAFVATTGHRSPPNPYGTDSLASVKGIEQLPVVQATWYDAKAYCSWAKKRLPTEAEWEKAAKGNNDWRFPWGNVEPTAKHLNYNQKWIGEKTLMPVGSYEAGKSPYGVYDMAGNVWEWVNDWYDPKYYEKSPNKNPKGPETGTERVLRGSGWQNETPTVRIFTRVDSDPTVRNESTGFRCARDAK